MSQLREFDRGEHERLRRAHECNEADRPTQRELSALFQRWELGQRARWRAGRLRPVVLAFALSSFAGGALALSGVLAYSAAKPSVSAQPTSAATARKAARSFVVERGGRREEHNQVLALDLLPGEHVSVLVNDVRTEFLGPGRARVQAATSGSGWVASFEPRGFAPRLGVERRAPGAGAASSASPSATLAAELRAAPNRQAPRVVANSAATAAGAWERTAEALRRGDERTAAAALTELSSDSDPATRDAALLAAAQLDLAAGRRERALPSLQALARSGATAFVRSRAAEVLNQQE